MRKKSDTQRVKKTKCPVCGATVKRFRDVDPNLGETWRVYERCDDCNYCYHSELGYREEEIGLVFLVRDWQYDDRKVDSHAEQMGLRAEALKEMKRLWQVPEVRSVVRRSRYANAHQANMWRWLYSFLERHQHDYPLNWGAAATRGLDG